MKQALTEALAWYADMTYLDEKDAPMVAAARLVERLLPGECPNPMHGRPFSSNAIDVPDHCPDCVDGQVWDEGIVEAVAAGLWNYDWAKADPTAKEVHRKEARLALSALVELLTEKAGVADRPVLDSIEGVDPSEYSIELSTQPSRLPE